MVEETSAGVIATHYDGQRGRRGRAWRRKFSSSIAQTASGVVQEQVFETRFGNVDIGKLTASSCGEICDFGNQRTAAIGVDVHAAFYSANFANTSQRLQSCD